MELTKNAKGYISLIIGPMYSGKTSELIRRYRRHKLANRNVIFVKYDQDNRYDVHHVVTHDGLHVEAHNVHHLFELMDIIQRENTQVVCIDEIQFYEDAVAFCNQMANEYGIIIEACGLNGDFQQKSWENISQLQAMVDSISFLTAICCQCGSDAPFTKRISHETEKELIGGIDKYIAVCRNCFNNNN